MAGEFVGGHAGMRDPGRTGGAPAARPSLRRRPVRAHGRSRVWTKSPGRSSRREARRCPRREIQGAKIQGARPRGGLHFCRACALFLQDIRRAAAASRCAVPLESLVVSRVRSCHATIRGMKKQQLYTRLGLDVVERVIRVWRRLRFPERRVGRAVGPDVGALPEQSREREFGIAIGCAMKVPEWSICPCRH